MFSLRNLFKGIPQSGLPRCLKPFSRPHLNIFFKPFSSKTSSFSEKQHQDALKKYTLSLGLIKENKYVESISLLEQVQKSISDNQEGKSFQQLSIKELELLFQTYYQLAKIHRKPDDFNRTIKLSFKYSRILGEVLRRGFLKNHIEELTSLENDLSSNQSQDEETKDYFKKASEIFKLLKEQEVTIASQFMMATLYGDNGRFDEALELLENLKSQHHEDEFLRLTIGKMQIRKCNILRDMNYLSDENKILAEELIQKALDSCQTGFHLSIKHHGEYSVESQNYCAAVTEILLGSHLEEHGKRYAEKSLEIAQNIFKSYHPKIAQAYLMIGVISYWSKDMNKFLESYQKAAEIFSESDPKQYFDQICFAYLTISEYYLFRPIKINPFLRHIKLLSLSGWRREGGESRSGLAPANSAFESALKIAIEQFGPESIQTAFCYYSWALMTSEDSLPYYAKALKIYEKNKETTPTEVLAFFYWDCGRVNYKKYNIKEAIQHFQAAIGEGLKLKKHSNVLSYAYMDLGRLYLERKKYKESQECFQRVVETWKKPNEIYLWDVYSELGSASELSGDLEKAAEAYKKAVQSSLERFVKETYEVQKHVIDLMRVLKKLKRESELTEVKTEYECLDYSSRSFY